MAEVGFERRQADALLCSQLHCHFSKQKRSHYHTKLVLGEKRSQHNDLAPPKGHKT